MSGPLLLMAIPLVGGTVLYWFRRMSKVGNSLVIGSTILLLLVLFATEYNEGNQTVNNLAFLQGSWQSPIGSFSFELIDQKFLSIIYVGMGLVFVTSLLSQRAGLFIPLSLLILSPLAGLSLTQSLATGALFVLISGALMALMIQADRPGSTVVSFRYLTLVVIAFVALLVMELLSEVDPNAYIRWTSFSLLLVLLILLFSFPFHLWVAATFEKANVIVSVVIFGIAQAVFTIFCLELVKANPLMYGNVQILRFLRLSGVLSIIMAMVFTIAAPNINYLIGYLLVVDLGSSTLALGIGGRIGFEIFIHLLISRMFSVFLTGFGLSLIRRNMQFLNDDESSTPTVVTLFRSCPLGVILLIFGGASLAGLPMTPGFAARWSLISLIGERYQWQAIIVVIASIVGALSMIRMFLPKTQEPIFPQQTLPRQLDIAQIAALVLLLLGVVLSFVPSLMHSVSQSLLNSL